MANELHKRTRMLVKGLHEGLVSRTVMYNLCCGGLVYVSRKYFVIHFQLPTDNYCSVYCICIQSSVMMVTIPQSMLLFMSPLITTNIHNAVPCKLKHASWTCWSKDLDFVWKIHVIHFHNTVMYLHATQDVLMTHIGGCYRCPAEAFHATCNIHLLRLWGLMIVRWIQCLKASFSLFIS